MAELTRVTIIENKNWEDKALQFIYIKKDKYEKSLFLEFSEFSEFW